ncbi:hypothetical protein RJ641_001047 [Dillenia turbinata]|uniref:Uncharacterized protein n=1 Tax=Dillenia turbinata TaxID=194707 RepID=A0AAN8W7H8_9MAGN
MAAQHPDDLDELLDSALDDFQTLNLASSQQRSKDGEENKQDNSSSLPTGVQGLGLGLPDLKTKKKGKQKVSREAHVSEALDKLREQTRETVRGLESMAGAKTVGEDFGKDQLIEDWVKQFEELSGSQVNYNIWSHSNCFVGMPVIIWIYSAEFRWILEELWVWKGVSGCAEEEVKMS